MNKRGGPSRPLSEGERTLWSGVTRHIQPLRPQPAVEGAQVVPEAPAAGAAKPVTAPAAVPLRHREAASPPPLAPLERRVKQQLARGKYAIDGRLDLHGLTQAEAHGVLLRFLQTAQARQAKIVMVITGKGSRGEEGGVLKRQVPLWLRLPEFRSLVVGFEEADPRHGGAGALYMRVRRNRSLE